MACEARQEHDEMTCVCGLRWDIHDPEPPTCRRQRHVEPGKPVAPVVREAMRADIEFHFTSGGADPLPNAGSRRFTIIESVTRQIPVDLPADIAREMAQAFATVANLRGGTTEAMRAAYRVFLDRLP